MKQFVEQDLRGISTIIQYAAQILRLKADASKQAIMSHFETRAIGLLRLSLDFLSHENTVEVSIHWTAEEDDPESCPIVLSLATGEFPLSRLIARAIAERKDISILFQCLLNTYHPIRDIQAWISGPFLRVSDFTIIPCDISRIHLRIKHRYGSAIVFELRFVGEGLISIDLLADAKTAQFFSPLRPTVVRFAQAARLDKLVLRAVREYYGLPPLQPNFQDDTPGQGEFWSINNSSGYIIHAMYLGGFLHHLQPYAMGVSIVCLQSGQKLNLSAHQTLSVPFPTWPQRTDAGQPALPQEKELVASLEIDDYGELRVSILLLAWLAFAVRAFRIP